jgi:hypothetical protein
LARLLRVVDVGKSAVGHLLTILAFRDIIEPAMRAGVEDTEARM